MIRSILVCFRLAFSGAVFKTHNIVGYLFKSFVRYCKSLHNFVHVLIEQSIKVAEAPHQTWWATTSCFLISSRNSFFNFLFITASSGANYNSLDLGRQFDESGTCFLFMKCVFGLGKLLARCPAESAGWIGEVDGWIKSGCPHVLAYILVVVV